MPDAASDNDAWSFVVSQDTGWDNMAYMFTFWNKYAATGSTFQTQNWAIPGGVTPEAQADWIDTSTTYKWDAALGVYKGVDPDGYSPRRRSLHLQVRPGHRIPASRL